MIDLPDVTLLAVSSIEIAKTIQALERSCADINFKRIKIITHEEPVGLPQHISFNACPKLNDIMDYNTLVFKYLGEYVETSHCLLIHYDSWVIHPELWENSWLKFDYIGAPWQYKNDAYICHDTGEHVRVGNGGFSLRSKKLLDMPFQYNMPLLQEQGYYNEDGNINVYNRVFFLKNGIKYAPIEVAAKFSYENPVPENIGVRTFGFHKNFPPWG